MKSTANTIPFLHGTLTLLCALLLVPTIGAQHVWQPDDLVRAETIPDLDLSPISQNVLVWAQSSPNEKTDQMVSHLYLRREDGKVIQLTRGDDPCTHPKFSPDGRTIAFLSEREVASSEASTETPSEDDAKAQIWLLDGGEPHALTTLSREVKSFAWRDEGHIVFTAQEPPALRELDFQKHQDESRVVDDEINEPPVRLFEVELSSRRVTRLTTNTDRITDLFVSPDGRQAVTFHSRSLRFDYDNQVRPHFFLTDLATGQSTRIFADPRFNLHSVVWAPDDRGFYAVNRFTTHPKYVQTFTAEVWLYELADGTISQVDLDWPRGVETQAGEDAGFEGVLASLPDGFVTLLANGVRMQPARYRLVDGRWQRRYLEGDHASNLVALRTGKATGPANTLAYLHSSASTPPQLFLASLDDSRIVSPTQVSALNPHWNEKPKAQVEVIRWKGARGDEIEGLLYHPLDKPATNERRPLVLVIHGGPFWADFDAWRESWHFPLQPHCERGAYVLRANYHGSSSYGSEFAESLVGDTLYYDLPVEDLERGIDDLINRGVVDPDRIGVKGWSNGALLTLALLVENPGRFKAAASGAGGFEWTADTCITYFGQAFNDYYFGKMPWEDPELYRRVAPFYDADRIQTPLIILHGDADTVVPIHHGWMQLRALQQRTQTPVRMVVFPGEEHGLKKLSSMRRKMEEEMAWFDQYLYETVEPPKPWLKEDSPLASLVARHQAAQAGTRFGLVVRERLIPEVVPFHGLNVGRFEVTQAQWAEFDPQATVQPGHENFPAIGVSYDQAQGYCRWLSALTGEEWRLPDQAEAERLYAPRVSAENTLDHWAGYSPNAEDTARLISSVRPLGVEVLLREVGSFTGAGKPPVFDLGGNVSEWTVGPDGTGRLAGGSADQPRNSLNRHNAAAPQFTGLRVIKTQTNLARP